MCPRPRPSSRRQSSMRGSRLTRSPSTAMRLRIVLFEKCALTACCQGHETTLFKVSEQSDRAGSPRRQVQNPTYARLQELRVSRYHDRWRGTPPSNSQRSIHVKSTEDERPNCASDLECRARRVKHSITLSPTFGCRGYLHQSRI